MKVLAVLVLAVFTGCNANLFYADAPRSHTEELRDGFWLYAGKITQTTDDTIQVIRKSQLGQDISARLMESADAASKYAASLQEQLPPVAQDLITKVSAEADLLKERVNTELSTVRERLEPLAGDLKVKVQERVEQLKQELAPYVDTVDAEGLRITLIEKSEELKASLEQTVADLQVQMGPYTEEVKVKVEQHLEDFKQRVSPVAEKVQGQLKERVQQVRELAAPYVEEVRDRLNPYADDLQTRLAALYESFVNTN
ncbi:apolipoprotein A-I-like [Salarias fasciatus]|uniref:apolipoprotein A-I-like n=1 Tax=Salarias fasciatus TaxID=181472 RepID=UPI001176D0C6|nr:apolipoprotein A-I-like [Salarias fasciatus]